MTKDAEGQSQEYTKYTRGKVAFILISIVCVICLFFISLCVGTLELTPQEVYHYLIDHLSGVSYEIGPTDVYCDNIVWNYRVPRTLFAIISGASLALGGCVMQSVMKNPLADPYTTGVSSGALFGVAVALVLGLSVTGGVNDIAILLNSLIFAMIPVIMMVVMAPYFRKSPSTLILAGIALSYLFNSLTSLILITTDSASLSMVYHWQIGSFGDLSWNAIPLTFLVTVIGMCILLPMSSKLNLMAIDDKSAKSLGLNIENLRVLCLVIISLMVAVIISYVGIIGFVGLVVPHAVRLIIGADNKYLIPASMAFGALFLLGCDIIARYLNLGASIPVGVVTSFLGAPIFLYLIVRQKKGVW